jgi:hypothetical protein
VDDQRLGRGMALGGILDRELEGAEDGEAVLMLGHMLGVILGRRIRFVVEECGGRGGEAALIFGRADPKFLAIGGGLLVGERQAAKHFRQALGRCPLLVAAGAGDPDNRPRFMCGTAVTPSRPLSSWVLSKLAPLKALRVRIPNQIST